MATIRQILPFGICLAGLTCVLALTGCQNSAPKYVGTWKGEIPGIAVGDSVEARTLRSVKLEIRADGTFDLFKTGLPCSGNIEFGDKSSKLKVQTVMGHGLAEQPPELAKTYENLSVDYVGPTKLLLHEVSKFGEETVELTKAESSTQQP